MMKWPFPRFIWSIRKESAQLLCGSFRANGRARRGHKKTAAELVCTVVAWCAKRVAGLDCLDCLESTSAFFPFRPAATLHQPTTLSVWSIQVVTYVAQEAQPTTASPTLTGYWTTSNYFAGGDHQRKSLKTNTPPRKPP